MAQSKNLKEIVLGCGYTLICEPHENLVMASTWISNFIAVLSKHFNDPRISEKTDIITVRIKMI